MGTIERNVIAFTICLVLGCVDTGVSDTGGGHEAVANTTPVLSTGAQPEPQLITRQAVARVAEVSSPIPFELPAHPAATLAVTAPPEKPADTPDLFVPAEIKARSSALAAVLCKAAPDLKLGCPAEAPTASTCSARENLPAGCQVRLVQGGSYPPNAYPACCR